MLTDSSEARLFLPRFRGGENKGFELPIWHQPRRKILGFQSPFGPASALIQRRFQPLWGVPEALGIRGLSATGTACFHS